MKENNIYKQKTVTMNQDKALEVLGDMYTHKKERCLNDSQNRCSDLLIEMGYSPYSYMHQAANIDEAIKKIHPGVVYNIFERHLQPKEEDFKTEERMESEIFEKTLQPVRAVA